MRRILVTLFIALPLIALAAPAKTVTLDVQNMTCGLCPVTIKKSLEKVPGVSTVEVSFENKTAVVAYDPDKTPIQALTQATTNAGFPSTVQK